MELGQSLLEEAVPGPNGDMPLVVHGRYHGHLLPFFDLFPRDQIKVVLLDDLENHPTQTLVDLQRFIGVEPMLLEMPRFNPSGERAPVLGLAMQMKGLARTVLPATVMEMLRPLAHRAVAQTTQRPEPLPADLRWAWTEQFYGQDLDRLGPLIGRDLSCWRMPMLDRQRRETRR
jgi:hypothetical protein